MTKKQKDKRNKAHGGKGRTSLPKPPEKKNTLTPKQGRFLREYPKAKTIGEAAINAGYSSKHPSSSGNQALKAIIRKGPEALESVGVYLPAVIKKHLMPLLNAKVTKFAQHEGKFTDKREVTDNYIRLGAVDKVFRLFGAYPSEDPVMNAKIGVDVIICDMPRKKYDVEPIDVKPSIRPPSRLAAPPPVAAAVPEPSSNGASKKDPRPKD